MAYAAMKPTKPGLEEPQEQIHKIRITLSSKNVKNLEKGLRALPERDRQGLGEEFVDAENGEEFMFVQSGVSIVLGNRPPLSPGTLYITTKQVVWCSDADRIKGYAVDFLSISLHAVSRDPEAYPSPCIYTQIDTGAEDDESEESDSECYEALDLSKITEMRLVPSDPRQLDILFETFCECAELNPEPVEENEGQHNWVFSADLVEGETAEGDGSEWISQNSIHSIGHSNGDQDLAYTIRQLQINDQRFEDAEEMDSDDIDDRR